jgi:hypothetical protein
VYVEPVARSGARFQVSARGGAEPHWSSDGGELFYLTADSYVASVSITPGETWQPQKAQILFRAWVPEPAGTSDFHVTGDGKLFVVNTMLGFPSVPSVQVIVGWTQVLGK